MSTEIPSNCAALADSDFLLTACSAIAAIPTSFWAAIFASLLTLSGVFLSNRNSRQQLLMRTDAEAEENRKQRKHELKREIYSEMTEAIASMNLFLSGLANIPLSKLDGTKIFERLGAATSKIQIVSESETAELAGDLSTEVGILWTEAIKKSNPAQRQLELLETYNHNAETAKQEWQRFRAIMTEAQAQRGGKAINSEWIKQNAEFWKDNYDQEQLKIRTTSIAHMKYRAEYIRWFLKDSNTAFEQIALLMGRMRDELEAGGDVDEFTKRIAANRAKICNAIENLVQEELAGLENQ